MRRVDDVPARPNTSSVLELSLVLIDPVAGDITIQTWYNIGVIEQHLPYACEKILIGVLVGPSILTPLLFCVATLIVSVYVNWGFRPVTLTVVLLNGTCTVISLDCLRLLLTASNTIIYSKKPWASSSDTFFHTITIEVPSEDLRVVISWGKTVGANEHYSI